MKNTRTTVVPSDARDRAPSAGANPPKKLFTTDSDGNVQKNNLKAKVENDLHDVTQSEAAPRRSATSL